MRWTTNDAERATSELELELRVAEVGTLLHHLTGLGEIEEPCVWCVGLVDGAGAALVADPRELHVFMHSSATDGTAAEVLPLSELSQFEVDAVTSGFVVHGRFGAQLAVRSVPSTQLAPFVAHLVFRIPSARRLSRSGPDLTTDRQTGRPTQPGDVIS